jgi:hypothetical protein
MARNYEKKSEPKPELAEIIKISNSDIEVFEEKNSFYKFGCEAGELRSQLRSIVKQCTAFDCEYWKGKAFYFAQGTYNIPQNLYFRIVKNRIVFAPAAIVGILQGVDVRRLKLCPICDQVFWEKRLNSKTCGNKDCVERLSGKKYHKDNKDAVNRKKREKYYEDNGIAFCSKCVRPLSTHGESDCQLNGVKNNGTL